MKIDHNHSARVLQNISVNVHCALCGDFSLGADVIAESQRLLRSGCPGSTHECPPELFASLLDASALAQIEQRWAALQAEVEAEVGKEKHLSRWEDDGGALT
jgi:hypothetical protein